MQVAGLLTDIIAQPHLHARFLNSLSYLEYRGARKIARVMNTEDIDDEVLRHATEEMGHALYFKKLALKVGGPEFRLYRPSTVLAEAALKHYFFALDRGVDELLRNAKKQVYYYVTWLIEERAVTVYREYQRLLTGTGQSISLKPILSDEVGHLNEVKAALSKDVAYAPLVALEESLFTQTWKAIAAEVESAKR